ncbi:MAG: hypothetical protein J7L15_02605 [Clostridiales bacterium]|nr:hypothetical protein [Clostridiales bacterium]
MSKLYAQDREKQIKVLTEAVLRLQTELDKKKEVIQDYSKRCNGLEKKADHWFAKFEARDKEIERLKEDNEHIRTCIRKYYDHCKNDQQVCGINCTAQIILN